MALLEAIRRRRPRIGEYGRYVFPICLVGCILMIWLHALNAGHYVDFFPINGTFQNFNPVRRFLDGQIPYRDFQDYLGMGHLYAGTAFTTLFGLDYRASLMAFSFLTLSGFAGISYVIGYAVFGKKEHAIVATDIVLVTMLVWPVFLPSVLAGMVDVRKALEYALGTGNSARFIRGMILPMSCALVWLGKSLISRKLGERKAFWPYDVMVGLIAGASFAWSNDYGISCWLCLLIMLFWYSLSKGRGPLRALGDAGIAAAVSLVSLFVVVEITTFGHFREWVTSTFGTGGYQRWYYNSSSKSYYLWDIDTSFIVMLQAGLCLHSLWKMYHDGRNGSLRKKDVILGYMNMVSVCAVEEYKLLSGGSSREVAMAVLFLTLLYEVSHYLLQHRDDSSKRVVKAIGIASVLACSAWIVSAAKEEFVFSAMNTPEGVRVEQLGGNLHEHGESLIETDKFLNGDKFFSMYASAQEVVSGCWQPSGIDYIIHVLGDGERQKYLESFSNDDFRYVATIKPSLTHWEYWVQRANWFFYRELYRDWHPIFANDYEIYWERNAEGESHAVSEGIKTNYERIDDATVKVTVDCDESVNGMADVHIDYKVEKRDGKIAKINIYRALQVKNTGVRHVKNPYYESNFLRDESAEYVPVPITDGHGEVTLTSVPEKSAYLTFNGCECSTVYTATSDCAEVSEVSYDKKDGVSNLTVNLMIPEDVSMFEGVSQMVCDGQTYDIDEIEYHRDRVVIKVPQKIDEVKTHVIGLVRTGDNSKLIESSEEDSSVEMPGERWFDTEDLPSAE